MNGDALLSTWEIVQGLGLGVDEREMRVSSIWGILVKISFKCWIYGLELRREIWLGIKIWGIIRVRW